MRGEVAFLLYPGTKTSTPLFPTLKMLTSLPVPAASGKMRLKHFRVSRYLFILLVCSNIGLLIIKERANGFADEAKAFLINILSTRVNFEVSESKITQRRGVIAV